MRAHPTSPSLPVRTAGPPLLSRHLDPTDAVGELLFGSVMTLTFTLGAGLLVREGEEATREILVGVLGCNLAWGLIDAGMYVMSCTLDRSRKTRLVEAVRSAPGEPEALAIVGEEFDERLDRITTPEERTALYREMAKRMRALAPEPVRVRSQDLRGAVAVFFLVFASTVPAVVPFLVLEDRFLALRVANALLLAMVFFSGYRWGRATGNRPWLHGFVLLVLGLALVAVAIAFGG